MRKIERPRLFKYSRTYVLFLGLVLPVQSLLCQETFIQTGIMDAAREWHTATLLHDGRVLVAGGMNGTLSILSSAEIYDPTTGLFTAIGNMTSPRVSQTAVLLSTGKVLIAGGGADAGSASLSSAELFDPVANTFAPINNMNFGRSGHTATLLPNHEVLIAGGSNGLAVSLSSAELYDPVQGTFTLIGNMVNARAEATATLLNNGKVLIAGGVSSNGIPIAASELYDPSTGMFTSTGNMSIPRSDHTATLLGNGNVLITAGYGGIVSGTNGVPQASAEIYSVTNGTFIPTGSLNLSRYVHTASILNDGNVLVVGGIGPPANPPEATAEIYDVSNGSFALTSPPLFQHYYHQATTLNGGGILLTGPSTSAEIASGGVPNSGSTPASVTITPPYIALQGVGDTSLKITNSGGSTLNLTGTPSILGSNASDFAVGPNTSCIADLAISPGNSCTLDLVFTPTTESWEVATLTLFDNASYGPQTVPLSGGGQLVNISPNPVPGSASSQTVTITGTNFADGAMINWQDLTLSAPDFQWTGTIKNPQVVSPTTITAEMNVESSSAVWQLEIVNPTSPKTTSNWYPFQVAGATSASSSFLDDYPFKNAPVDQLDDYRFASDECTSYVAWRMNRDAATTDPSNPSFFRNMAGGDWGNASNWGANANTLGYKPDPSPKAGDIAQWNSGDHVAYVENVNLDGSVDVSEYNYGYDDGGTGGIKHQYGVRHLSTALDNLPDEYIHIVRLSLSPATLTFGDQAAGTASSQTIEVTNSQAQSITFPSPGVIVGASEAAKGTSSFVEGDTCSGNSIAPDAQCQLTVTFAPPGTLTKGGIESAAIILNWGAGPQLIPVNGIALTNLNPSSEALSFGKVPVGKTSAAKTVKLTNNTGADMTISSISPGPEFGATGCSAPLANGNSCTVSITFSPTAKGLQSTTLVITDTAINSPQKVSLKGTGT